MDATEDLTLKVTKRGIDEESENEEGYDLKKQKIEDVEEKQEKGEEGEKQSVVENVIKQEEKEGQVVHTEEVKAGPSSTSSTIVGVENVENVEEKETPKEQPNKNKGKGKAENEYKSQKYKNYDWDSKPNEVVKVENLPVLGPVLTTDASRKRKVAIVMGYNGSNYHGVQRNPGVHTVEDDLEMALYKAGGIIAENMGNFQKINFMRCARTDKGVSAMANVFSLKLLIDPPTTSEMVVEINKYLGPHMKVFSIVRVNKSFDAKNDVSRRAYDYILPSWVFAPRSLFSPTEVPIEASSSTDHAPIKFMRAHPPKDFKFDANLKRQINSVLWNFLGTKSYHNYTTKGKYGVAESRRYIVSFECSDPFVVDGMELVKLTVIGQSFIYNQIRKMVAMVISIMHAGFFNSTDSEAFSLSRISKVFSASFGPNPYPIPKAPALGLYLDRCLFTNWENRYCSTYGKINSDEIEPIRDEFKTVQLYSPIVQTEQEKFHMVDWMSYFLDRSPLDLLKMEKGEKLDEKKKVDPVLKQFSDAFD